VSDLLLRQRIVEGLLAAGYSVEVAGGPTVVGDKLAHLSPVALVIDLETRSLDAVDLIAGLRADPGTARLPVLGVFGHVNTDVRDRALAAGADHVATRGEMAMRLDRLMGRLLPASHAAPAAG
jgi:CheY-like chemotaxis protein